MINEVTKLFSDLVAISGGQKSEKEKCESDADSEGTTYCFSKMRLGAKIYNLCWTPKSYGLILILWHMIIFPPFLSHVTAPRVINDLSLSFL